MSSIGGDLLIYFTIERIPVGHAAVESSHVDEIETCLGCKDPFFAAVLNLYQKISLSFEQEELCNYGGSDLERQVCWNKSRLYGRQIRPYHN